MTSIAFTCVIVSIAKKIRGRLMRQIYSLSQQNWSGDLAQMLGRPLRFQTLVITKAFVSCVARHCQVLRSQACSSSRQGAWTLKSLWRQQRISFHPAKLFGTRGWRTCQSSGGCQVELPTHNQWLLADAPTLRSGTPQSQAL